MRERWRPIPDWEGYYSVSNRRRVRSETRMVIRSNGTTYRVKGRILRPRYGVTGAARYSLARNHKSVDVYGSVVYRKVWADA
jgi:NUMOD4 motif